MLGSYPTVSIKLHLQNSKNKIMEGGCLIFWGGCLIIIDMDKFVDMYLNDEFEENAQQPPIQKTATTQKYKS